MNEEDRSGCLHPITAHDRSRGMVTCSLCGEVVNDQQYEADAGYRETVDFMKSLRQPGFLRPVRQTAIGGPGAPRPSVDGARRAMTALARPLQIPSHHVEEATQVYKLALNNNAVAGAKSNVLCACMYIVCRRHKTPHMVLDFCDVSQDDPYSIVSYVSVICRTIHFQVPIVDPSLYIERFASQLGLGERQNDVCICALKILRYMRNDWILTGRRPLGACAAALVMACDVLDLPRPLQQVVGFVRLSATTVEKRITEFQATPVAQANSLDGAVLSESTDPPAFIRGRLLEDEYESRKVERHRIELRETLIVEANKRMPATPERIERWKEYWSLSDDFRLSMQGADVNLDLANISHGDQLVLLNVKAVKGMLGFKKDVKPSDFGPNAAEKWSSLLEQGTKELRDMETMNMEDSADPTSTVPAATSPAPDAPVRAIHDIGPDYDALSVSECSDVDEFVVFDNEERVRKELHCKRLYGEAVWDKVGAPREERVRGDKRPRAPLEEAASPIDAIVRALKGKGARTIDVDMMSQLLPGHDLGGGVAEPTDQFGEVGAVESDDEWPVE